MTDWIANSESGASVRGKLNSLMVPISSHAVSSPVEYLDMSLPSGYDRFLVLHQGVKIGNGVDALAAALSADAGATFMCDATNFDTYGQLYDQLNLSRTNGYSRFAGGSKIDNSTINTGINDFGTSGGVIHGDLVIWPGSASSVPSLDWDLFYNAIDALAVNGAAICDWYRFKAFLNPSATVTPSSGRVNLIRFLPYGNGDCAPPTSGETISAGTFALFGLPAIS